MQTRESIDTIFKWKLEDIYQSDSAFEDEFEALKLEIPNISALSGSLKDASSIKHALDKIYKASLMAQRLYVYSHMRRDEDNANSVYQQLADRAMGLNVELEAASSFISPELIAVENSVFEELLKFEGLQDYSHMLENLMRQKAYVLDSNGERLLAMASEIGQSPATIFKMLDNADLRFDDVDTPSGKQPLTHGNYITYLEDSNREVRRDAFEKMYAKYAQLENTYASIHSSSVKNDAFCAKARGYDSSIHAALFEDNVPLSVYDGLISVIHDNIEPLNEYISLHKKALSIDELHMYDLYTPMMQNVEMNVSYEDAKRIVKEGLSPLGSEYSKLLDRAYNESWIDVYENSGKSSGAYCWGVYGTHPYVLMNYQNGINSMFTLAHELGHAMHSYYSDTNQPYAKSHYNIFVAEVASTVNEVLLMKYMLENEKDKSVKQYLLNYYLEQFRTTVFRQTMFAEFEKRTHQIHENGESLSTQRLKDEYYALNQKYYSCSTHIDEQIALEWARIPHFYNAFYVYKYATGFSAAIAIANRILQTSSVREYNDFLSSGGSSYPIDLLKIAGVDLSTTTPIEQAMDSFRKTLKQLKQLMEE